jgi:hypothetical protein
MERTQRVESKFLISTIGAFLLCFILSSLAYGQDPNDPGEPDTVWIGKGKGFGVADRSFPIPVELVNECDLSLIGLPLRVHEVSTFANLDSVSFVDRLTPDTILDLRGYNLEKVDGLSPDSFDVLAMISSPTNCLPSGSGRILNLWFTGDSTGFLAIDSCHVCASCSLIFGVCPYDIYFVPVFVSDTIEIRECGDVNQDNEVGLSDVVYLINYVFRSGPEPIPISLLGDVNEDNTIDIIDVVFLINYLFRSGLAPCSL